MVVRAFSDFEAQSQADIVNKAASRFCEPGECDVSNRHSESTNISPLEHHASVASQLASCAAEQDLLKLTFPVMISHNGYFKPLIVTNGGPYKDLLHSIRLLFDLPRAPDLRVH